MLNFPCITKTQPFMQKAVNLFMHLPCNTFVLGLYINTTMLHRNVDDCGLQSIKNIYLMYQERQLQLHSKITILRVPLLPSSCKVPLVQPRSSQQWWYSSCTATTKLLCGPSYSNLAVYADSIKNIYLMYQERQLQLHSKITILRVPLMPSSCKVPLQCSHIQLSAVMV